MTPADLHKLVRAALDARKPHENAGEVLGRLSEETGIEYRKIRDAYYDMQMGDG